IRYSFNLSPFPRKVCSETNSRNLLFFGELAKCLLSRIRRSSSRFSKREIGRAPGLCKVVNAFYQLQAYSSWTCPSPNYSRNDITEGIHSQCNLPACPLTVICRDTYRYREL